MSKSKLKTLTSPKNILVGGLLITSGLFLMANLIFGFEYDVFAWLFVGFSWFIFAFFQYKAQTET